MKNPAYTRLAAELREAKREMKADGIRVVSCFNAGLSRSEYSANARLFRIKAEMDRLPKEIAP